MWVSILREGLWAPIDQGFDVSAVPWGSAIPKVKGGEALDAAGGLAPHCHGSNGRMLRVRAALLQRKFK